MMAVEFSTIDGFKVTNIDSLFDWDSPFLTVFVRSYDVASDGRFMMRGEVLIQPQPVTEIRIVKNWAKVLNQLAPIK